MNEQGVCRTRRNNRELIERLEGRVLLSTNTAIIGSIGYVEVEHEVDERIYVNGSAAGSTQTGAIDQPFLTINAAVNLAKLKNNANIGVKVVIAPGMYRESVSLKATHLSTTAPIVLEAATPGTVTMSGSDIYTGWQVDPNNSSVYTHTWTNNWGFTPNPWPGQTEIGPAALRRELVFADGQNMHQVLSYGALSAGSFYVDEGADKLFLRLPDGMNIANANIEVGVRAGVMVIQGYNNVVVRGMTFTHDVSELVSGGGTSALWIANSNNVLLENNRIEWNTQALSLLVMDNVTVRNTVVDDNAFNGIGMWKVTDGLVEDVQTNHNNWRGVEGNFTIWSTAGIKALLTHNTAFRDVTAVGNKAPGIWLDTDVARVDISGSYISDNLEYGIITEAVQGPISITNNVLTKNSSALALWCGQSVFVENNIMYGSVGAEVHVSGAPGGRPITDFETNQFINTINKNWTFNKNVIVGTTSGKPALDNTLPAGDFNSFTGTLTSNNNIWYNATTNQLFQVVNGVKQTMPTWRNVTGEDMQSLEVSPAFADPANNDFNHTAATPSLVDWTQTIPGAGGGLTAQYFANETLTGPAITRTDWLIHFNWNSGSGSPDPSIPQGKFSTRWSGHVEARYTETYTFHTRTDDGVRLWVNGQLLIDDWNGHAPTDNSGSIALVAGQKYSIVMEYMQLSQGASASLSWSSATTPKQIIPSSQLFAGNLISGNVFNDKGSNGVNDGADTPVSGWTVYLDANNNNAFDAGETSTTTDASGNYSFVNVASGTQHVKQVLQSGYRKTNPGSGIPGYDVVLGGGTIASGKDFGVTTNIYLAGTVYNDANNNNVQDAGEPGIAGVTIDIVSNETIVATRVTDSAGKWQVKGLSAGTGSAVAVVPVGYLATNPGNARYDGSASSGQQIGNLNFGLRAAAPAPVTAFGTTSILNPDGTSLEMLELLR